jgi:nitrite reductase/ring-hydroxylating ferredoxin subunit
MAMSEWKEVGPADMLADGQMVELPVEGLIVLLARVEGAYYAAQGLCPHMSAHLAEGRLNGFVVTCPRHSSTFDLRDGRNVEWIPSIQGIARRVAQALKQASALSTFATRVQDGQVWVETP